MLFALQRYLVLVVPRYPLLLCFVRTSRILVRAFCNSKHVVYVLHAFMLLHKYKWHFVSGAISGQTDAHRCEEKNDPRNGVDRV